MTVDQRVNEFSVIGYLDWSAKSILSPGSESLQTSVLIQARAEPPLPHAVDTYRHIPGFSQTVICITLIFIFNL